MDIFFRKQYNYSVPSSFNETRERLKELLSGNLFNLSKNYYGTVTEDGEFTFKRKFVFFRALNYADTTYLKGKISKNDKDTNISITISPNVLLVFVVYLLPLICINIFFGDNSLMGQTNSRIHNFSIVLMLELILVTTIQISSFLLRQKFENTIMRKAYRHTLSL